MFTPAAALSLDPLQKHTLESLARAGSTPQRLARKCEVILLAAEGIPNNAIAQKTGLSLSFAKMLSGANAFEISDIEEGRD